MAKDLFKKFFEDYSKNVDNASSQYFWRMSDEIILAIITKYLKDHLPEDCVILDAGGGTGRWIQTLSKKYDSKFILYDMSMDMLNMAKKKEDLKKMDEKLEIIQGDIQNMSAIKSSTIDYLISIYNPVSFIKSPLSFFKEIRRTLKLGGIALVMGQSLPNAIASKINNYLASGKELKRLDEKNKVKWSDSLAPLNVFSKESLEELANKSRLKVIKTYGIPVFLQPGPEDFDPENKLRSKVSSKLENAEEFFKVVYNLEMKYNSLDTMVNRGMNLMIVVEK